MEAGQIIGGRYRLVQPLGAGGMASVWSAVNVFTDRAFAIKFMLPHVARTPEAARRFLLEAKVSGRIDHPNVVEMIDVGQTPDGSLFLVMELLTGVSLDEAVRRRDPPMSVHRFALLMRDVAGALAEAHRIGIIHRDLKPTNVFLHLDREGRTVPKLLDFGVSKVLEGDASEGALTAVGTILGSPFYMSPEQAMGSEDLDARTDVFAFGSILFEALSGERTYEASNLNALLVAIATMPPKSIDVFAPELPEPLRALVRECTVPDRTRRIGSFSEIVERLDALLPTVESSNLLLPPPKGPPPPRPEAAGVASGASQRLRRRASDRPGPLSSIDVGGSSPPISIPMSAPFFIPEGSLRHGTPFRRMRRARPLVRSALGVLAGGAAILAIAGFVRRGVSARTAEATVHRWLPAIASGAPDASSRASGAPPAESSADVPTVSVDALPIATREPAVRPKGGRLTVTAGPGQCSLSIDGVPRGVTPLRAVELSAGIHRLACAPPGEKDSKTVSISVSERSDAYYRFVLPE